MVTSCRVRQGDKEPNYLDQHWSKGSFSFANWGFWCNFKSLQKQNFKWKLILMHIVNPRWSDILGAVRQQDVDAWPTCPALTQHWRLWSVFSPTRATAFVCYTLIVWLCNAAHQGQPCRAAGAWNKEVLGLDEIQFLFWNCTKWFLPVCSLCLTHNLCNNETCTSDGLKKSVAHLLREQ